MRRRAGRRGREVKRGGRAEEDHASEFAELENTTTSKWCFSHLTLLCPVRVEALGWARGSLAWVVAMRFVLVCYFALYSLNPR